MPQRLARGMARTSLRTVQVLLLGRGSGRGSANAARTGERELGEGARGTVQNRKERVADGRRRSLFPIHAYKPTDEAFRRALDSLLRELTLMAAHLHGIEDGGMGRRQSTLRTRSWQDCGKTVTTDFHQMAQADFRQMAQGGIPGVQLSP